MRKKGKVIGLLLATAMVAQAGSMGSLHAIAATDTPIAETEPNDTYGKATTIQTGQAYVGNIKTNDDKDWYKFEITKDGYFQIKLTPDADADTSLLQYGWKVSLYDEDATNSIRVFESCTSFTSQAIPYAPGIYYLKIEDQDSWYNTYTQKYNLSVIETEDSLWETEGNNKSAQASELILNQKNTGYIESNNDVDWFKFSITEPGYFTLKLAPDADADTSQLNYGWNLVIYKEDNTTELETITATKVITTREYPFAVGNYYIKLSDNDSWYSTQCQPYNLTLQPVADATWENENFETTTAGAKKIDFGTEYKGYLDYKEDVDYFSFTLDKASEVSFDWNIFDNNGEDIKEGWKLSLLGGAENASLCEFGEIKATGSLGSIKLPSGQYYVKIAAHDVGFFSDPTPLDCKYGFKVTTNDKFDGFVSDNGKMYWYEGGVRQGTYDDANGVKGDGTIRGREIYDPETDGWYWLDSVYDGAKACNKEVWMPYVYQGEQNWDAAEIDMNAGTSGDMKQQVIETINNRSGKWVRYDADGKMYKGWYTVKGDDEKLYPDQKGNTYYYDPKTGLMAKGTVEIEGKKYEFDTITGVLIK